MNGRTHDLRGTFYTLESAIERMILKRDTPRKKGEIY